MLAMPFILGFHRTSPCPTSSSTTATLSTLISVVSPSLLCSFDSSHICVYSLLLSCTLFLSLLALLSPSILLLSLSELASRSLLSSCLLSLVLSSPILSSGVFQRIWKFEASTACSCACWLVYALIPSAIAWSGQTHSTCHASHHFNFHSRYASVLCISSQTKMTSSTALATCALLFTHSDQRMLGLSFSGDLVPSIAILGVCQIHESSLYVSPVPSLLAWAQGKRLMPLSLSVIRWPPQFSSSLPSNASSSLSSSVPFQQPSLGFRQASEYDLISESKRILSDCSQGPPPTSQYFAALAAQYLLVKLQAWLWRRSITVCKGNSLSFLLLQSLQRTPHYSNEFHATPTC